MRVQNRPKMAPKLLRPSKKKPTRNKKSSDKVSLSRGKESWYTPAVKLTKSVGIATTVGVGLGVVGFLGGLPAVGVAMVGGAIAGGSVTPALFKADNALGTALAFTGAAALGMTGPIGIVGAGLLGAGACLNAAICTQQTEFS